MLAALIAASLIDMVLAALVVYLADRRLPVRGKRLIVNLVDGSAMRGILIRSRGPWLVLANAELLRVDTATVAGAVPIDGTAYVERPRVLFVQVLP